jgi:hypothetical protein
MATVKGVRQTLIDDGVGLSNQIAQGFIDGRVKVYTDTVADLSATQTTATDVLELFGDLPAGSKVLMIKLVQTGTQTSTISVGDSASATRYLAAGNTGIQTAEAILHIPGHQYVIGTATSDSQIIITFAGAVGATGVLYAEVYVAKD